MILLEGLWQEKCYGPLRLRCRANGRFPQRAWCWIVEHPYKEVFGGHESYGDPFPIWECSRCGREEDA